MLRLRAQRWETAGVWVIHTVTWRTMQGIIMEDIMVEFITVEGIIVEDNMDVGQIGGGHHGGGHHHHYHTLEPGGEGVVTVPLVQGRGVRDG